MTAPIVCLITSLVCFLLSIAAVEGSAGEVFSVGGAAWAASGGFFFVLATLLLTLNKRAVV